MDWKAIGNIAALVGVMMAMDDVQPSNGRMDRMQTETNARFDAANKHFDTVLEAIMS